MPASIPTLCSSKCHRPAVHLLLLLCLQLFMLPTPVSAAFDFDQGNAPFEVIIPTVIPIIVQDISPNAGDPSLIFRVTTLVTNGWFDAIAPYHRTAVGVYSRLPRQPLEPSNRQKNVAIFYASHRILSSLFPKRLDLWDSMLTNVGLDPDDQSNNPHHAIGIGNRAGKAVIRARLNDGMNQLGNEGGCNYNCQPYADYLGYQPVNTAYTLIDPSRWQPSFVTKGNGLFSIQQFVTPQLGVTRPYSYHQVNRFRAPKPHQSQVQNFAAYKAQADEVLDVSASLTDRQKVSAELFDHKFNSVFSAVGFTVATRGLDLVDSVIVEFLTNMASFDTAIAIWHNKRLYDSVRPFSAIAHIYAEQPVSAWGGPGVGTVNDLPANQWTSYLPVANHPEYPSATASFCAAHAQVLRKFFGADDLGFSVTIPAGASVIEPGLTPAQDVTLTWDTWTDLENECGESRVWAGVHFEPSVPAGMDIGHKVGNVAYRFVQRHLRGRIGHH